MQYIWQSSMATYYLLLNMSLQYELMTFGKQLMFSEVVKQVSSPVPMAWSIATAECSFEGL